MEWFKLGGWGMYPILIVGLVTLGASASFAAQGDERQRGAIDALVKAVMAFMLVAVSSDLITVFFVVKDEALAEPRRTAMLLEGLGESLTPLTLGGALLALSWVLISVGQRRAAHRV